MKWLKLGFKRLSKALKWFAQPSVQQPFHAFFTLLYGVLFLLSLALRWELQTVLLFWGLYISHLTALIAANSAQDTIEAMVEDERIETKR